MGIKGKIKNAVIGNLCRSYALARLINLLSLKRAYGKYESGVIVFQMGKVGSSSIYESLKRIGLNLPIYHAHVLRPTQLVAIEKLIKANWSPTRNPLHLWHSLFLQNKLKQKPRKKWKVITLVRDPIARNISAFFQTKHLLSADEQRLLLSSTNADELRDLFLEKFYAHDAPISWFDDELKSVFGVDVFKQPFPRETGYCVYEGEMADVLLIRLEDLGRCQTEAIREFLGIDDFQMKKANVGKDKSYSEAYSRMLSSIRLPEAYIEQMYQSKYTQHFYSSDEIAKFSHRWLGASDVIRI